MQLELSDHEAQILHETLRSVLSDLSVQIADTDRKAFRDGLKLRRDLLRAIFERLAAEADA